MNNAMYGIPLDYARLDWVAESGLLSLMLKRRWTALVAGKQLLYRRPVVLMEAFEVETRVLGWDGRWVYLSQHLRGASGKSAARALVRWTLHDSAGKAVDFDVALAALGCPQPSPPLADEVLTFAASQDAALAALSHADA